MRGTWVREQPPAVNHLVRVFEGSRLGKSVGLSFEFGQDIRS